MIPPSRSWWTPAVAGLMKSGELEKLYEKLVPAPIPPKNPQPQLPDERTGSGLIKSPNDKRRPKSFNRSHEGEARR
jgi:hypothetical protein